MEFRLAYILIIVSSIIGIIASKWAFISKFKFKSGSWSLKGDIPLVLGSIPLALGDLPLVMGNLPSTMGDIPLAMGDLPKTLGYIPMSLGYGHLTLGGFPMTCFLNKKLA
jgi:hypothetical protein